MLRFRCAISVALCIAGLGVVGVHPATGATGSNGSVRSAPGDVARPSSPQTNIWVKRYNGPSNQYDAANAQGISPDGSTVFVTGSSFAGPTNMDYATVAYDASTGATLWVRRYKGPTGYDAAFALEVSPDGSAVFVTGFSHGWPSDIFYDYATVAYDASTGATLWVKRYNGPGDDADYALALGVSPDGSAVFVTGYSYGSPFTIDYATVAYDASTGATLWVRRYNGPGNDADYAFDLGVSPDGSTVFVTGESEGSTGFNDFATVAYDASTGATLWVRRYIVGIRAWALDVSPDGSMVFVTGAGGSATNNDFATVTYDSSSGATLWTESYNGTGNADDLTNALGVSPDGSTVFVTGYSAGSTSSNDYATVAYDTFTGTTRWVRRYNGTGNADDLANALGVNPAGSTVFVTGGSIGTNSPNDAVTVAYDASTGAQLWVERYNNGPGIGSDQANDLGVSPDGSTVFVAGYSEGSTSSFDYFTVAYSTT
jgi:hypothetical protein